MKAILILITTVLVIRSLCSCEAEKIKIIDNELNNKQGDRIRWIGCLVDGVPEGIWERENSNGQKLGSLRFERGRIKSFSFHNKYGNELVYGNLLKGKLHGQFSYKYTPRRGLANIEGKFSEGKMIGLWTLRWIDGSDWITIDYGTVGSSSKKVEILVKHNLDSLKAFKTSLYHKELGAEYSSLYNKSLNLRIQAEKIKNTLKLDTASNETIENYFEITTFLIPDSLKGLSF